MAETKDKLVDLESLKAVHDDLSSRIPSRPFLTEDLSDSSVTMDKLAQDVKDAIGSGGSGGGETDIAVIRRVVNEQLAKMKFTVNEDGHLIIETPEE